MKKFTLITIVLIAFASLFGQAIVKNSESKSNFLKQPYLIFEGNNTQMRVIWQLNESSTCHIFWGTDTDYNLGNTTTTEYGDNHQHSYTITDLTPSTKYYYKVEYGDTTVEASFYTAPEETATELKFFMYGDTRTHFDVHDAISEAMIADYSTDPAYQTITICTGDLVEFGAEESSWQNQFFTPEALNTQQRLAELPFISCLGNHELYYNNYSNVDMTTALFGKYFPYPFVERRYWSFDYGPVHFTYIDLYPADYDPYDQGLIDDDQLAWIENDLSTSTKDWKIIVLHEPGWSAGDASSGYAHPNNENVQNLLQPLCEQYGVQLVFGGHNHYYAKACKNGLFHLTAAGGGAPLYAPEPDYPNILKTRKVHHYCKAEINDHTLSIEVLTPYGDVVDEISIEKDILPSHLLGYLLIAEGDGEVSNAVIDVDGIITHPDSTGYWGLQLEPGTHHIGISLPDYQTITTQVEVMEGAETVLDKLLFLQTGYVMDTSFYSEALQEEKMVDVYFPSGYDDHPNLHYPVIYYLHGWGGDQNFMSRIVSTTNNLIKNGIIEPVIIVGADNSPEPFDGSCYINSTIWGNYEDYMTEDLIAWVEASFRTVPDRKYRGLIGNSMGGSGAFRYGILHKDKFRALASHAASGLVANIQLEQFKQQIILEHPDGPPYFYDYNSDGPFTKGVFLFSAALVPNANTPQTYINPPIVEFLFDENATIIDSILAKWTEFDLSHLIHQLSVTDSVGIYFACGIDDDFLLHPSHLAFRDTLDVLGLPYEFYSHNGNHTMPSAFKIRALTFLDSLLMPPILIDDIHQESYNKSKLQICIFPNPTNNKLNIKSLENSVISLIEIFNIQGGLLKTQSLENKQYTMDMGDLPSGVYIVSIHTNKGNIMKKLIKQ